MFVMLNVNVFDSPAFTDQQQIAFDLCRSSSVAGRAERKRLCADPGVHHHGKLHANGRGL